MPLYRLAIKKEILVKRKKTAIKIEEIQDIGKDTGKENFQRMKGILGY